jgi:selenocysteine-specific elongation factor
VHVVATAGHVEHGKSMLVRALTGMEPDRWEAERRRGMTIDLGYARATLPSGDELAFVDVPGHERFITNMLAGVGPVPAVMFVVAADEGWMPESAEHLAAIDALGVRHGVLAVTRADLADPGPALRQAARTIADTSIGELETVAASALTRQGLPQLIPLLEWLDRAGVTRRLADDRRTCVSRQAHRCRTENDEHAGRLDQLGVRGIGP